MNMKDSIDQLKSIRDLVLINGIDTKILNTHFDNLLDISSDVTEKCNHVLQMTYESRNALTLKGRLDTISNLEIKLQHVVEKHSIIYAKLTLIIYNKNKIDLIKDNKRKHKYILDIEQDKIKLSFLDSLINIFSDIEYLINLLDEINPRLKEAIKANR